MKKAIPFRRFGTMVDCSRNAVMTVDSLKRWIDLTADMGYNTLMLYTEDTYEVAGEPFFGYLRGRYSKEELKTVDAYARSRGMELIPCIQTLAHLNAITRWNVYQDIIDIDDILLAEDERTWQLIDRMFQTLAECFTSRVVNVGMDEAHHVGRGKYFDLHGSVDRTELLVKHIEKVSEIAAKYGFSLIMWSDMFFRLCQQAAAPEGDSGSAALNNYYNPHIAVTDEIRERIPENVSLIYWDYYHEDRATYDAMLTAHGKIKGGTWFAGGAWAWDGPASHNSVSIRRNRQALASCAEHGVEDVFITLWGDDGCECSRFAMLPALYHAACIARGEEDEDIIRASFRGKYGVSFEDFLLLDMTAGRPGFEGISNSEKYLLYNDPFMGIYDPTLHGTENADFARAAELLAGVQAPKAWRYLFKSAAALAKVLRRKAQLGENIRRAYAAHDLPALDALAAECRAIQADTEAYYRLYRRQWYTDNKGQGFEIIDVRLGGLMCRLGHCAEALEDFAAGRTDAIGELEETLLAYPNGGTPAPSYDFRARWQQTFTACVL